MDITKLNSYFDSYVNEYDINLFLFSGVAVLLKPNFSFKNASNKLHNDTTYYVSFVAIVSLNDFLTFDITSLYFNFIKKLI